MQDQSFLDKQYFIDGRTYNCPYCNRRHLPYAVMSEFNFDWDGNKKCYGYIVMCASCVKGSLHLSWFDIPLDVRSRTFDISMPWTGVALFDDLFFYHQPTSFFTVDNRIHHTIRELIAEADGCRKMNYLTGASACLRKAIYELLKKEGIGADVGDYNERIKVLKSKFSNIDPIYFDVLGHIKDMTSDKLHEESWEAFDSSTVQELLKTLQSILYEMYVLPDEKKDRLTAIPKLLEKLKGDKKVKRETQEISKITQ